MDGPNGTVLNIACNLFLQSLNIAFWSHSNQDQLCYHLLGIQSGYQATGFIKWIHLLVPKYKRETIKNSGIINNILILNSVSYLY